MTPARRRVIPLAPLRAPSATLLSAAMLDIEMNKWRYQRGHKSNVSQVKGAIDTLIEVIGRDHPITVEEVTTEHLKACVRLWRDRDSLAHNTINKRLNTLSALGVVCIGLHLPKRLPLKWWLPEDQFTALMGYLRASPPPYPRASLMADYVEWATFVGMRVEETLRLKWTDVRLSIRDEGGKVVNKSEITVPGTKTQRAQVTLRIALIPALLLQRRQAESTSPFVFPIKYDTLEYDWRNPRAFLGVTNDKMATLKALRRTAARNLTVNGMPAVMLMQYLRHTSINTTMGYLHLTGGYNPEEQGKWLD